MEIKQTIFALSEAPGPSGQEGKAVDRAAELIRPYVDCVSRDAMGNLIARRKAAKEPAGCVLLDAHLDEVCMLVTGHDKGFLQFTSIGIDARILPGLEVKVCCEPPIYGVVNCLPPHILSAQEREKPFDEDKLRIDCGLTAGEAAQRVPVGTAVVYGTKPFMMGEKTVCGKSLDDRACFATLIRTMELLKDKQLPVDVCVLGSMQEEYSGMGAAVGAFSVMPDWAVVVDVTFADTPDSPKEDTIPLGGGPSVGVGPTLSRKMSAGLLAVAAQKEIPVHREILPGHTGTNSMQTQISREGVPSACVSVPLRYMHTPIETVNLDDIENTARLIAEYVLTLGKEET